MVTMMNEWVLANGWLLRGDQVSVQMKGHVIDGVVVTAIDYGTSDKHDWHIQMNSPKHGYVYYKQGIDGGNVLVPKVEVVNDS